MVAGKCLPTSPPPGRYHSGGRSRAKARPQRPRGRACLSASVLSFSAQPNPHQDPWGQLRLTKDGPQTE